MKSFAMSLLKAAESAIYIVLAAWMCSTIVRFQANVGKSDTRTAWVEAVEGTAIQFAGFFGFSNGR